MTSGHFPTRWKTATVISILESGKNPTQPSSHRPISLLHAINKIVEHIILSRLNYHLENNNILCSEQFGFRKNLSTTHQLIRDTEFIEVALINLTKNWSYFPRHSESLGQSLARRLNSHAQTIKTPSYIAKIIKSYLTNRNFMDKVNNEFSDLKQITAGVAQGSKIGDVLFSMFINDIPKQYNTMLCMYADDAEILAKNKNPNYIKLALIKHLKTLEKWFRKRKIELNVSKTEAIMFSKCHNKTKFRPLKINDKIIEWSQKYKYPGVILDKKLK
ncbi:RNA-directed DNA polymerase from mobile element jockey [Araneus ventricosus]|uniref:RNA-directed DNA polymerase from mobile element jockey n=1 Tax=Araneus ventricosus TaxID=182803 RepID=A0A4Y2HJT5_ARAVE|nr:RNA-directed DNA polymerase from mobile element jockey [Araneus ventricosus]